MGVHGLWKLVDPSGKPVPLETLENKILAVDVSIWLHQVVKGFQDAQGNPLPNAHLLGLFHRVCKLLFYKIKPVFVFDGGVPLLKKQTVIARRQQKSKAELEADRAREQLLKNLVKHTALRRVLGTASTSSDLSSVQQRREDDMFVLPPENKFEKSLSGSDDDDDTVSSEEDVKSHRNWATADLHAIDVNSAQFKTLPADVRHDILSELKETRKQSSWGRLHEMPKESSDFSSYQVSRLLKRRSVQVSLEDAEREMGGHSLSLGELENLLNEQGVVTNTDSAKRIASDSVTRYLYVKEIGSRLLAENKPEVKRTTTVESISNMSKEEENKLDQKFSETGSRILAENKSEVKSTNIVESISNKPKEEENKLVQQEECRRESKNDYLKDVLELIPEEDEEDPDWCSDAENDAKLQDKNDLNLKMAENFIFENSGLTQKQILAVIQYQNAVEIEKENEKQCSEGFISPDKPSTSGVSSTKPTIKGKKLDDSFCDEKITNKDIYNFVSSVSDTRNEINSRIISGDIKKNNSEVDSETTSQTVENVGSLYSKPGKYVSIDEIKEKEDESTVHTEPSFTDIEDNNDKSGDVSNETRKSSSDTDDETFVEVDEVFPSVTQNTVAKRKSVEVIIDKNKSCELEDDIFADIFAAKSVEDVPISTKGDYQEGSKVEVIIDKNKSCALEDDIFADIFAAKPVEDVPISTKGDFQEGSKVERKNSESNVLNDVNSVKNGINEELKIEECKVNKVSEVKEEDNESINNKDNVKSPEDTAGRSKPDLTKEIGPSSKMSTEDLNLLQVSLEKEQKSLLAEQGRQERLAANITDQMCLEAQELLQLFGVPYIIAPMEAEAQCAFLDLISLTDGTITDDSDIWLFGGQKVYKNFFNQKKHVMHFKAADIKHYFKLERLQMILFALLVGSDYTPGIQGVGPVTALEILASFPPCTENVLAGLQKFRDWLSGGMKVGPGKTPLKNKLRNVVFTEGFPSLTVVDAYLNPKVDESNEAFSWAMPDLDSLRDFTRRKFGWTRTKADEILLPVMKKLEERKSQKSIDSYFKIIPKLQAAEGHLSKRVKQAVERMGRTTSSGSEDDPDEVGESSQPKRRRVEPGSSKPRGRGRGSVSGGRARGRSRNIAPVIMEQPINTSSNTEEFIPQRERDKINALKSKLRAIEVFRTSKIDKASKKQTKVKRRVLKEAKLSESSSDSN